MVSSLAAAISDVGLDVAHYRLDCEHYSGLRHVALAHTWTPVGGASRLGDAGGIRMRGGCRGYRFRPDATVTRTQCSSELGSEQYNAPNCISATKLV
jgi:hypothetical protein